MKDKNKHIESIFLLLKKFAKCFIARTDQNDFYLFIDISISISANNVFGIFIIHTVIAYKSGISNSY